MGELDRNLVVQADSMAKSEWPEVAMVVLWPAKGSVYHDNVAGAHGMLHSIFGHPIVVMSTNAAVFDPLEASSAANSLDV
jgi:hypothetical protein